MTMIEHVFTSHHCFARSSLGPFDIHIRRWFGNKESKLDYKTRSAIRGVYLPHRQEAIISYEKVTQNKSVETSPKKKKKETETPLRAERHNSGNGK